MWNKNTKKNRLINTPELDRFPVHAIGTAFQIPQFQFHRSGDQLRTIERTSQRPVEMHRILLGQQERFSHTAIFGYVPDVRQHQQSVTAAARKNHPIGMAAPAVVTFHIGTVPFFQQTPCPVFQIQQGQFRGPVIDREGAKIQQGKKDVPAVG